MFQAHLIALSILWCKMCIFPQSSQRKLGLGTKLPTQLSLGENLLMFHSGAVIRKNTHRGTGFHSETMKGELKIEPADENGTAPMVVESAELLADAHLQNIAVMMRRNKSSKLVMSVSAKIKCNIT